MARAVATQPVSNNPLEAKQERGYYIVSPLLFPCSF